MPRPTEHLPLTSLAYAMLQAARIDAAVLAGQSLADGLLGRVDAQARPAVQDLVYGSLRAYGRGDFFLQHLLTKPLAEAEVHALLLVALYRLETRPEAVHTVVDQAVLAAGEIANGRFKALVNGVLRNFLRQQSELTGALAADAVATSQLPDWWLARLQAAYPQDWQHVVAAGNQPPPMALRVNGRRIDREAYRLRLQDAGIAAQPLGDRGLALARPVPVDRLPGFGDGWVSVQDPGAQRAAEILSPVAGSRVLDACAAPGGKTAHLLELSALELLALDLKPSRSRRVTENLERLGLFAEVKAADCARLDTWWDGRPFDAILADVPCTASGVVRRNPDAKWLRREADIASFAKAQARILDALWQTLVPGGKLLYATCSVFPEENSEQMARFLSRQPDAQSCHEEQILPDADHDGFFYCLLKKHG
ncbi:16S rRNA (cytosine(967)-C(5))-methyltransferase RsmB [Dechloromonas sp.]|uniref:16S rRNA (cytosine(967)-C(5))-methyltransferase RsmB n=1 Tax=Dechloromonas sp. TaxID=1917218 RepID=UPI0011F59B7E|nr:16S rRNA (cytosine(967)-C(5))-methyltransferase RsmB [Dechloromonas sp.]MBU3698035.1 16S rRNA (cytosine(967)-C(5))-methyltransferase RsmB [Dechloromonas sp.]TEX44741.1 MAG: 16S rRNA (cytosine(967)-C(5))-methyltransferase [Rhodocyclaceae bacterium]